MAKENMKIRMDVELETQVNVDDSNKITYAAMDNAEKDEDMHGPYDSVSDLMEALNA